MMLYWAPCTHLARSVSEITLVHIASVSLNTFSGLPPREANKGLLFNIVCRGRLPLLPYSFSCPKLITVQSWRKRWLPALITSDDDV